MSSVYRTSALMEMVWRACDTGTPVEAQEEGVMEDGPPLAGDDRVSREMGTPVEGRMAEEWEAVVESPVAVMAENLGL
jgi:hypothetical protein